MDVNEGAELLNSLSGEDRLIMFGRLSHELTVVARDTYEVGSHNVKDAARLRALNEIQHQMTSVVADLIENQRSTHSGSSVANIFLGEREDKSLERLLQFCFQRVSRSVGGPL